jgi:hypothetical protein
VTTLERVATMDTTFISASAFNADIGRWNVARVRTLHIRSRFGRDKFRAIGAGISGNRESRFGRNPGFGKSGIPIWPGSGK